MYQKCEICAKGSVFNWEILGRNKWYVTNFPKSMVIYTRKWQIWNRTTFLKISFITVFLSINNCWSLPLFHCFFLFMFSNLSNTLVGFMISFVFFSFQTGVRRSVLAKDGLLEYTYDDAQTVSHAFQRGLRLSGKIIIKCIWYTHILCLYTYVRMHVCIYVCMYVCTVKTFNVLIYVRTYVRMHVCIYVCMYVCMYSKDI